jgi:uncharacterized protein DUF488
MHATRKSPAKAEVRERKPSDSAAPVILTIGHSTRPIDEFIALLQQHGVERLVDIRTIPRSRHNPQFNSEALAKSLACAGIEYAHLKELGGLRHPRPDSINMGWRNASFRGYADYMQTPEFQEALQRLLRLCEEKRCAVMCAEAVPWRCHRSLLADALLARGIAAEHIMSGSRRDAHSLTPFARVEKQRVFYPKELAKEEPPKTEAGSRSKPAAKMQAELKFDEGPSMPRKKGMRKFTAATEARRRARLAAGTPPAERVIPDKRRKPAKHKKVLEDFTEI